MPAFLFFSPFLSICPGFLFSLPRCYTAAATVHTLTCAHTQTHTQDNYDLQLPENKGHAAREIIERFLVSSKTAAPVEEATAATSSSAVSASAAALPSPSSSSTAQNSTTITTTANNTSSTTSTFLDHVLPSEVIERCIQNSENLARDLFHECLQYVQLTVTTAERVHHHHALAR